MAYANDEQTWLNKWRREGWTFPFGSLMAAYGAISSKPEFDLIRPANIEQFEKDAWALYLLAKKMTEDTAKEHEEKMKKTAEPNDIEITED
jgi:hypothetical protein